MRWCRGTRLPAPALAKELAVPPQQGVGLDDEQGMMPNAEAAGQQHQQGPVSWRATRALDATPQDDELLTEERILSDEFRFAPHQIGQCADDEWSSGWFRGDEERW